jgi:hypothetical protein
MLNFVCGIVTTVMIIFSYSCLSDFLAKYKKTLPQPSLLEGSGPMPLEKTLILSLYLMKF